MPMPVYNRKPPITRTAVGLNTTTPIGTTYAAAKLEAVGRAPAGDGMVSVLIDASKTVTPYFFDMKTLKWKLLQAAAAVVANTLTVYQFPANAMFCLVLDATTANMDTSANAA